MITTLTAKNFILQDIDTHSIGAGDPTKKTILLIKAQWCGHCNRFLSTFDHYSETMPQYNFSILEETKDNALLNCWKQLINPAFEVQGYPTLVLYDRDGTPIKVIQNRNNLENEL